MVDNRAHSHGVGNREILKKLVNYDISKLKSEALYFEFDLIFSKFELALLQFGLTLCGPDLAICKFE